MPKAVDSQAIGTKQQHINYSTMVISVAYRINQLFLSAEIPWYDWLLAESQGGADRCVRDENLFENDSHQQWFLAWHVCVCDACA